MQSEQIISTLPKRMKGSYSNKFKTVTVSTNHYALKVGSFQTIYIFKLVFTPNIAFDNAKLRNEILGQAIPQICQIINNPVISGMNIYTVDKPKGQSKQVKITHNQTEYTILVKKVKEYSAKGNPKVLLQFLNNGLRNLMKNLNYSEIGKSNKYFNIKNRKQIDEQLCMFSGFKSNFVFLEKGIFLRVDTAKKIVRNTTVLQAINQLYESFKDRNKEQKRHIVKNQMLGKIIMSNYGKTRYYKIQEIHFIDMSEVLLENQTISLLDYYKNKYQIFPKKTNQPIIQAENKNSKAKIYLIPEFCLMTGIPQNIDEMRRKKISQSSNRTVGERKEQIQELITEIKKTQEIQTWNQLGLKINEKMENINAKIIPPPKILLGNNNCIEDGKQANFTLFSKPIYSAKHELKLGILYFNGAVDVSYLINTLESTSKNLKVGAEINKYNLGDFNPRKAIEIIQNFIQTAKQQKNNICLIALPSQIKNQYKKIKQFASKISMITQIITESTMRKKNGLQSIFTKVLLQIIAKRGNILWVPKNEGQISKTMLIGFQVAKMAGKTILSACGTTNSTFTTFCTQLISFKNIQEKFQSMKILLLKCVQNYIDRNKQPPKNIIMFHNSFSTDTVKIFREMFIEPALEKLQQSLKQKRPGLSFVTFNGKTNERFFIGDTDNYVKNVKAGTLISQEIVSNNYDFFLVSQFTSKGCALPNHYQVIYNDTKIQEGLLQELVFSQCFNYANWTGSIKIPGIIQYAKKCAKYCGQVLETQNIPPQFQNKLFFI